MNVITAMGEERLNFLLKKEENINVIGFDIQYQDGIFEILEENKNIDFLILNINLFGELYYEELIEKIKEKNKNINLIIILEKENIKIKNFLIKNNIKYIFNKENFNLENLIFILKNKKENNLLNNNFKKNNKKNNKILLIKNKIINKLFNKKIINKIKLIFNKKNKLIKNGNCKIKIVLGIKIKNIINKKIKIIKYENKILNKKDLEKEILKIIKEEL